MREHALQKNRRRLHYLEFLFEDGLGDECGVETEGGGTVADGGVDCGAVGAAWCESSRGKEGRSILATTVRELCPRPRKDWRP